MKSRNCNALLTTSQVADLLGVSAKTLCNWRAAGRYPLAYVKIGHAVRYEESVVMEFIRRGRREFPAESGGAGAEA